MGILELVLHGGCDKKEEEAEMEGDLPNLSSVASSVIRRCSRLRRAEMLAYLGVKKGIIDRHSRFRILLLSVEQLQQSFEDELPDHSNQPTSYARSLVEYCAYKALRVETQRPDHLADKGFSLLTFDMMLAWEAPDTETEFLLDVRHLSTFTASYLQNPLKFITCLSATIFYF
ncbi:hypothetical protein B296_00004785 [Ensete ventricosum]|uniref:Uncharacterized protein n=1 Tax=Ensete ventricosum TaxID=4639 RepID=A0A426ZGJ8_ENSVE|nr:hypothetical protein B296_00004785 [Ensete ventricosum]